MGRTDRVSLVIHADHTTVFAALTDPDALLAWLPPRGMRGRFEQFGMRPGGSYRLALTYEEAADAPGKTSADTDVMDVRITQVVQDECLVQEVVFEADDPAFQGVMQMEWGLLADAWSKAPLVRAGQVRVRNSRMHQSVEMVMGTRSPFRRETMIVGEAMEDGELYLAQDGVETPLRLSRFIRLSTAPSGAQFTSYFYNRTESDGVHFVSYQHGPQSEMHDALDEYQHEFGSLVGD